MYQQQQQRQLEGVADLLANQGRYGDSMLVHMNPVEVQGLASMSPTGSLTVNPQTGQPEAFLPFLVPLLGSLGGSALAGTGAAAAMGLGGLSSTAMGAIGSGLASWAATGDLKQGLVSGITGFGIGSAMGGLASGTEGAKSAIAAQGAEAGAKAAAQQAAVVPGFDKLVSEELIGKVAADASKAATTGGLFNAIPVEGGINLANPEGLSFGDKVGQMFSKEGITALTSPQALIPAAVAEGYNAEIAAEEAMRKFDKAGERMSEAELARQGEALLANQFNPNLTPAPYDPGGTDYGAQYANAGGIVSLDPSDFRRRYNGLMKMGGPIVGMMGGGEFPGNFNFGNQIGVGGYGNPIPAQQQAALRDPYSISPGQLQDVYAQQGMPGFGPEIMYFSPEKGAVVNPFKDWVPDEIAVPVEDGGEGGGEGTGSPPDLTAIQALSRRYQAGEITQEQYLEALRNLGIGAQAATPAAETTTGTTTPASGSGLSAEDYANLYSQYMNYSDFNISPFAEGGKISGLESLLSSITDAATEGVTEVGSQAVLQARGKSLEERFDDAFLDARERGAETFAFEGEEYSAKTAEEELSERREVEKAEDEPRGPLWRRHRDDKLSGEERYRRRLQKEYDDFIVANRHNDAVRGPISRGAQMRADALIKEREGKAVGGRLDYQEGGETQVNAEADRLIDLAAMAVLGELPEEEAGVVVQAFIDEFGEEAFSTLRESVLEGIVPGSQKEGEIVGPGGGMDDQIMGMIGNQQPVAVSPGEYIVPADVVSGIGDGSTDSGVQELDGMLDRVRMERTNTTQQPRPLRKGGVLPR